MERCLPRFDRRWNSSPAAWAGTCPAGPGASCTRCRPAHLASTLVTEPDLYTVGWDKRAQIEGGPSQVGVPSVYDVSWIGELTVRILPVPLRHLDQLLQRRVDGLLAGMADAFVAD